jgi:carboxymethylenebutenolidase
MSKTITLNDTEVYEVPASGETKGGLIVVHEIWGLKDHTKAVAERFAKEGYHVLAPALIVDEDFAQQIDSAEMQAELFHPDPERRNAVQPKLRAAMTPMRTPEFADKTMATIQACFDYLYEVEDTNQKVAITGFCFGGSYSFKLAVSEPRLAAAIPFYGHGEDLSVEDLRSVTCPILAFYGEDDKSLMEALPRVSENMHEADADFTAVTYPDAGHAFFNDTNKYAYKAHAAEDAWPRALSLLEKVTAH